MVEVFTTNVTEHHQATMLEGVLSQYFPSLRINFDIEDCDKILRVEGEFQPVSIVDILAANGYECRILE